MVERYIVRKLRTLKDNQSKWYIDVVSVEYAKKKTPVYELPHENEDKLKVLKSLGKNLGDLLVNTDFIIIPHNREINDHMQFGDLNDDDISAIYNSAMEQFESKSNYLEQVGAVSQLVNQVGIPQGGNK